ncbi:MAG: hypothetical protein AAB153_03855 [Pseudomonadota bacterium]
MGERKIFNRMNRKVIFIILGVVIILILGYSLIWMKSGFIDYRPQTQQPAPTSNETETPPASTQTTTQPSNQPTSPPEITDNWKTYRSEEYGFEFRYPADWKVVKDYSVPARGFVQLQQSGSIAGGINIIRKPISSSINSPYEKMLASTARCPDVAGSRNLSSESQYEEYVYCLTGKEIPTSFGTWKGTVECSASAWYGMKVDPETCPHEFWIDTEKFFYVVHFNLFEPIKAGGKESAFFDKLLKGFSFF